MKIGVVRGCHREDRRDAPGAGYKLQKKDRERALTKRRSRPDEEREQGKVGMETLSSTFELSGKVEL